MAKQVKSKVRSMLFIFFDIKGIVRQEYVLAGQTVNVHTTVTFYGDWGGNAPTLRFTLWRRRTACCITTPN
jgi:hypothetical protein